MRTAALEYELPAELIATAAAEPRDAARLLVAHRAQDRIEHRHVRDLADVGTLLRGGDLLVLNQSKVLPARFEGRRARTGGRVEGLYHAPLDPADPRLCEVILETRGRLQPGEHLRLDGASELELLASRGEGRWHARLHGPSAPLDLLARIGTTPLPPYIRRQRRARELPEVSSADQERYNTVYARDAGSVAAPTAGLHFTRDLLQRLCSRGVRLAHLTLHVGLGTFAPIRAQTLADHPMHSEWFSVPAETIDALRHARAAGGRIIPVGTTSVRALESLPQPLPEAYTGQTRLFIRPPAAHEPPFAFRFTDALLTNFHLPRSTLLALVAALPGVGLERLLGWYRLAIHERYRFYSYGDAMLVL